MTQDDVTMWHFLKHFPTSAEIFWNNAQVMESAHNQVTSPGEGFKTIFTDRIMSVELKIKDVEAG